MQIWSFAEEHGGLVRKNINRFHKQMDRVQGARAGRYTLASVSVPLTPVGVKSAFV